MVKLGECTLTIAYKYGFHPDTIWMDKNNDELRQKRKDPYVLQHDVDSVYIPEKRQRYETGISEKRNVYRRNGLQKTLKIYFFDAFDKPHKSTVYKLDIDGVIVEGETDANGLLEHRILSNVTRGSLVLYFESGEVKYDLNLGHLPPIDSLKGVQARLNNAGLYHGEINGVDNDETKLALKLFQAQRELDITGIADQQTIAKLNELHES